MLQASKRSGCRLVGLCFPISNPPRCTCAFSSSCRQSQHEPSPSSSQASSNHANTSAYDALFAGLPASGAGSPAGHGGERRSSYGPIFDTSSYARLPARPRKNRLPTRGQRLNPADVTAFRESMDIFFPKQQQQQPATEPEDQDGGIQWRKLLDTVQATEEISGTETQPLNHTRPREIALSPEVLQDNRLVQTASERFLEADEQDILREEVRSLDNPVDALNWMEDRIFSSASPTALASKITDAANPPELEALSLYPWLLTDLSNLLRGMAPHAALLPLKIASTHSPASYLHGCTAAVYASALKTRWEVWGDVEGCLDLLEEMERGAASMNNAIFEIVGKISDAVAVDTLRAREAVHVESENLEPQPAASKELFNPFKLDKVLHVKDRNQMDADIDGRLFFSNAQRRAVTKMEKLVMEHRARLSDSLRREDMLSDTLRQRTRNSRNLENADEPSVLSTIVDSYGHTDFLGQSDEGTPALGDSIMKPSFRARQSRPRSLSKTMRSGSSPTTPETRSSDMLPGEDVLSAAVTELSAVTPRLSKPARQRVKGALPFLPGRRSAEKPVMQDS